MNKANGSVLIVALSAEARSSIGRALPSHYHQYLHQYLKRDPDYSWATLDAASETSAIAMIDEQPPDAVLLSLSLPESTISKSTTPESDSLAMVERLVRAMPETCPLVVIAAKVEIARQCLKVGAKAGLLAQQVTPESLQLALSQAIASAQAQAQLKQQLHQASVQISQSESHQHRWLETSPDCLKLIDLDRRLLYMNANGRAVMEIEDFEPYRYTDWLGLWPSEQRQKVVSAFESAKAGKPSTFQGRCPTAQGTVKEWEVRLTPLLNEQQQVDKILSVSRDVSDAIQSKRALQEANIQLESVLASAEICTWRYDMAEGMVVTDAKLAHLFGIEAAAAAAGLPLEQFVAAIHPDDRDRVTIAMDEALATGQTYRCEFRVGGIDGKERTVIARGRAEYDDQGNAVSFPGALFDISDRIEATEAIKRSEQHSRKIIDSLFSFIGIVTPDGQLIEANRTALEAAGLEPDEVLGKPFEDAYWWSYSPKTQQRLRKAIQQALGGKMVRYDTKIRIKDNQLITIDFTLVPVLDDDGQVEYLIPSGIDITERKQAEQALKANEDLLRLALSSANAGSWVWTISTGEIVWSPETYALYGLDPADGPLQYADWEACLHPDDRQRASAAVTRALEQATPRFRSEFRIIHPEHGERWLLGTGSLTLDEQGCPVQFTGINIDITNRKRSEIQSLETQAIITQQLLEIEAVYHNAPIGLAMLDKNLRHVRLNQQLADINGLPIDMHVGRTVREMVPDLAGVIEPMLRQILETGEPNLNLEMRGETPALPGVERVWLASWYPLKTLDDEIIGINAVIQDITERKQAEQEREQLLAREQAARQSAETVSRVKDEFLAIVSHELRTPLNPILGWSQLLSRGGLSAQKTKRALAIIVRSAKMQAELIDDLLDVSRILRGNLSLKHEAVSLAYVLKAAMETVRLSAEAKSIAIRLDFDATDDIGSVMGDVSRLQQVIWNLLSNAIKFTPADGRIDVEVRRAENDQAQIAIRDTGKGIPADFLPHVFDRFSQEDGATTRKAGGLGLGLAIARHLAELHGGTLGADSPGEGQGATFTVTLPLMLSNPAKQSGQVLISKSSVALDGLKVLVVDDDDDAREIATFILEDAGAIVTPLASGYDALATLRAADSTDSLYDLLVSDIGMPGLDGYQLMEQVRALPLTQGAKIKAISLTAYAAEIDHQKAQTAGFHKHVTKPVEPDVLLKAIASVLALL